MNLGRFADATVRRCDGSPMRRFADATVRRCDGPPMRRFSSPIINKLIKKNVAYFQLGAYIT
jgi:hypothetical protein